MLPTLFQRTSSSFEKIKKTFFLTGDQNINFKDNLQEFGYCVRRQNRTYFHTSYELLWWKLLEESALEFFLHIFKSPYLFAFIRKSKKTWDDKLPPPLVAHQNTKIITKRKLNY